MVIQFSGKTEKSIRTVQHAEERKQAKLRFVLHYRDKESEWHELAAYNLERGEFLAKALIENGLAVLVTGWTVKEDGRLERSPAFKYVAQIKNISQAA